MAERIVFICFTYTFVKWNTKFSVLFQLHFCYVEIIFTCLLLKQFLNLKGSCSCKTQNNISDRVQNQKRCWPSLFVNLSEILQCFLLSPSFLATIFILTRCESRSRIHKTTLQFHKFLCFNDLTITQEIEPKKLQHRSI